jgi:hypothetical protein
MEGRTMIGNPNSRSHHDLGAKNSKDDIIIKGAFHLYLLPISKDQVLINRTNCRGKYQVFHFLLPKIKIQKSDL